MNKNNLTNTAIDDTKNTDTDKSGFLLGTISAVLMILCISVLLLFNNKQVQRIITQKINADVVKQSSDIEFSTININDSTKGDTISTRLKEKILNSKTEHPNSTVGRLTNIYFTEKNTIIDIAVTNGSQYAIHLNLNGKGTVLLDDLGDKYNLEPPSDNPNLKIESGTTFKGELVFQGGISSQASHLTLITNNKIGTDQRFSRRPKMKFEIPITEQDKKKETRKQAENNDDEVSEW